MKNYVIFSLCFGPALLAREMPSLACENPPVAIEKRLGRNGETYWIGTDFDTFHYWKASGDDSAFIPAIFHCKDGKYTVDKEKMSRAAPNDSTIAHWLDKLKREGNGTKGGVEWEGFTLKSEMCQHMLDLIFAGQKRCCLSLF